MEFFRIFDLSEPSLSGSTLFSEQDFIRFNIIRVLSVILPISFWHTIF